MSAAVTLPSPSYLVAKLCRRRAPHAYHRRGEYADKRQPAHACAFAGMP